MAFTEVIREVVKAARNAGAQARATDLAPIIFELQAQGIVSLKRLAQALNERGVPAAWGGKWSPMQVKRVLDRLRPYPNDEQNKASAGQGYWCPVGEARDAE